MILAVLGLFYFFIWHYIYRPDRARLERRIAEGQRLLDTLGELSAKGSDVEEERRRREKELEKLRLAVPETLQVDDFIAQLSDWAGARGIEISDVRYEQDRTDRFERARVRFRVSGTAEAVTWLWDGRDELERLVEWADADGKDGELAAVIYAIPKPYPSGHRDPCGELDIRSMPWPFSERISEGRKELDRICGKLRPQEEKLEQIASLRALSEEAEVVKQFIAARKG